MNAYAFTPVDSWFFGDSTPYHMERDRQAGTTSVFPPNPPTVVGAIRAGLARQMGWDGRSRWADEITDVLGDGYDDIGELSLFGPHIVRHDSSDGPDRWQRWYAYPLNILGRERSSGEFEPTAILRPGPPVNCDLGTVRLPTPDRHVEGQKTASERWISSDGLRRLLTGQHPRAGDIVSQRALWRLEPRVGLRRARETGTADDNDLYSPNHVRMTRNTGLAVELGGTNLSPPMVLPFGGESRLANVEPIDLEPPVGASPEILNGRIAVYLLTPLRIDRNGWETLTGGAGELGELFGPLAGMKLVSACLARPRFIGGWDSLQRRPIAPRGHVSPGGVLFLEGNAEQTDRLAKDLQQNPRLKIGERTEQGYGEAAVGIWND